MLGRNPPLSGFPVSVALRRGADGRPEMVLITRGETPDALYEGEIPEITYVYTEM